MKTNRTLLLILTALSTLLSAADADTEKLFEAKCAMCHITDLSKMKDKSTFIAPPADEIMLHMKEEFTKKEEAVKFMADYILAPDPAKAHCASIEYFGMMPAQKGIITQEEAAAISGMMYDKYPRDAFAQEAVRGHMTFEKLDQNKDGSITAKEFQLFRAKKNKIDPNRFVNTYYFDKLDLNHDGKMDQAEFAKMRDEKRSKMQR